MLPGTIEIRSETDGVTGNKKDGNIFQCIPSLDVGMADKKSNLLIELFRRIHSLKNL